jgi:excisionase family DNA binding protein
MNSRMLTTGQAAKLCSVTPDTVLKWIHSGTLPARRTAGGHHRIDERDLASFLAPTKRNKTAVGGSMAPSDTTDERVVRYCWEYNSGEDLPVGCRECVVYQMRAQRCYEAARLNPEIGHTKLFCKGDCLDCDYYRRVHLQGTNVMVVSDDTELIHRLSGEKSGAPFSLEITDCEYSCSALVDAFRPDYVVVDCALGPERSGDICNHLAEDPRLPYVRVVMAVREGMFPTGCDKNIFARMQRPFNVSDITECIHRAQN